MNRDEEMKMTYSRLYAAGGKKCVSVRFERGEDVAEGGLPECKIKKNRGFSTEEVEGLEHYLELKCDEIYAKAKEISKITHWI